MQKPILRNSAASATGHQRLLCSKLVKWGGAISLMNMDTVTKQAVVAFMYRGKSYCFRFKNLRESGTSNLNTLCFGLCNLINLDIRGIMPFEKTGHEYLQLPGGTQEDSQQITPNAGDYALLELPESCTDIELKAKYFALVQTFHPDRAQSELQKKFMEVRTIELNVAYGNLKRARGLK